MRDFESEVAALLTELVEFLESLDSIKLPDGISKIRGKLLGRSRRTLFELLPRCARTSSPEPYLDMTANLKKSVENIINGQHVQLDGFGGDYVPECYEVFDIQSISPHGSSVYSASDDRLSRSELSDTPDYSNLSAGQAKAQASKWTQMDQRREPRKMTFGFGFSKSCFAGLVGTNLLLYNSEQDSRPYLVLPLHGYKARPVPANLGREQKRGSGNEQQLAHFEMFCPGDKTFQFVAKSTKDMEDWIEVLEKLQQSLDPDRGSKGSRDAAFIEILSTSGCSRENTYKSPNRNGLPKAVTPPKAPPSPPPQPPPPPIPLRLRRLPSPPRQSARNTEHYNDDDQGLYHKIEDIGIARRTSDQEYQNCPRLARCSGERDDRAIEPHEEMYDDVRTVLVQSDTYDDVFHDTRTVDLPDEPTYNDVECGASPKASKTTPKRSFLDRVRNRGKDCTKKEEKKKTLCSAVTKLNNRENHVIQTPPIGRELRPEDIMFVAKIEFEEAPHYDDAASLRSNNCGSVSTEDEYLCPPPPRPIYSSPPTILSSETALDEIYDDIGSCKSRAINGFGGGKPLSNQNDPSNDDWYQVPKANNRPVIPLEELYDDVQFDTLNIRKSFSQIRFSAVSNGNSQISDDLSTWDRTSNGKKLKTFETKIGDSTADSVDAEEGSKIKPLQKLINKMENTLGKTSKSMSSSSIKSSNAYA